MKISNKFSSLKILNKFKVPQTFGKFSKLFKIVEYIKFPIQNLILNQSLFKIPKNFNLNQLHHWTKSKSDPSELMKKNKKKRRKKNFHVKNS